MKILFVCKHNRFRSKVAEAIFRKLNKNTENSAEFSVSKNSKKILDKKIEADSAGTWLDKKHNYVEPVVKKIMKEKGYKIKGKPKHITLEHQKYSDLMIITADNVAPEHFPDFYGKILWWKIKDCDASEIGKIRKIIEDIERRVRSINRKY